MSHTPGRWTVVTADDVTGELEVRPVHLSRSPVYQTIAQVGRGDNAECVANANLIAAVPDLLEAAIRMHNLYAAEERADHRVLQPHGCNLHAGMEAIRAALKRAGMDLTKDPEEANDGPR